MLRKTRVVFKLWTDGTSQFFERKNISNLPPGSLFMSRVT